MNSIEHNDRGIAYLKLSTDLMNPNADFTRKDQPLITEGDLNKLGSQSIEDYESNYSWTEGSGDSFLKKD